MANHHLHNYNDPIAGDPKIAWQEVRFLLVICNVYNTAMGKRDFVSALKRCSKVQNSLAVSKKNETFLKSAIMLLASFVCLIA